MSEPPFTDRRRVARTAVTDTTLSLMAFPIPVRLVDISLAGVLMETAQRVDFGTQGTVRFNFAGVPFSAEVRVERVEPHHWGSSERFKVGASFVSLSSDTQRVIERFADQ